MRISPLILLLLIISLLSCGKETNQVLRYFENAEIQCETEDQKNSIINALNDILTLDTAELKEKRYADYRGQKGEWTIQVLLYHYFVPDAQSKIPGDNFFNDIKSDDLRDKIKSIIIEIK